MAVQVGIIPRHVNVGSLAVVLLAEHCCTPCSLLYKGSWGGGLQLNPIQYSFATPAQNCLSSVPNELLTVFSLCIPRFCANQFSASQRLY